MDATTPQPRPCWIAGRPEQGAQAITVNHPFDGTEVASVAVPGPDQLERAVAAAAAVAREFRRTPAHVRAQALLHVSQALAERAEEIAETITAENGKPLKWANVEVTRAVSTFRFAAEEARRFTGDLQRLDTDANGEGRLAVVRRIPRGPVLAVAPFNFPLNLVAHKVAPALAVGAPVIVKPASATPLSALLLGEILAEADLPEGVFSVLPVRGSDMKSLVTDERLPVISFTGSTDVGWSLTDSAPRKHVVMELGSNSAAIVCPDWPDLDYAASRIATFGNYQAGQSCIAVQRVLVHRDVAGEFVPKLVDAVRALRTGDPHDPEVEVGPLIDEDNARRVEEWITEAVSAGATLHVGGGRSGSSVEPAVVQDVPPTAKLWHQEVFGPVLAVSVVGSVGEAFEQANATAYGLQAGVFTRDVTVAFEAAAELEVGGVIIGDVPSYRADQMPYGGVKGSGTGREGVRSAMVDFTEERTMVLTGITL
ncbi:acyl-CoA reductase-like NAD-dependent aldehyde dehydrogenase [Saccharothrix tamanrassetensis]|uniref:Acyl-CoA reductase-like NAD-dependent aldehyde dehydrogenase n=1 Tax=Saccharothrix tamanrassetensis TaxID=1051531 RepID=A0A841CFY9_9PSEU|nr:aldehyde dehydrogenase family protein [Saccharothrix tamanrassetensis]MBB5954935.1 acyl-CoA reductase-like NAD-dependent aldehyde dehydrogenase [Saccharothrix tamanrassetensis]